MPEENINIKNGSLVIEGLLSKAPGEKGVIICHPHPLMGGSMHNNVVEAIQAAFARNNYTTLRFNFRGAGASTGIYDEGRGEQDDIITARNYLASLGMSKITLAGYSFGAWVCAKVMETNNDLFDTSIFVSPPINMFDFNFANLINKISLLICGDNDQFCDIDVLYKQAAIVNAHLEIIHKTDHFYYEKEEELVSILCKYINNL